jgi:hypothetical protein
LWGRKGLFHLAGTGLLIVTALIASAVPAILLNVPSRFLNPGLFPDYSGVDVMLRTYAKSQPADWVKMNEKAISQRDFLEVSPASAVASARRSSPRAIELDIQTPQHALVAVKQLYYPSWRAVTDNRVSLVTRPTIPEGMIGFEVPPGRHRVSLVLERTSSETAGAWVSAAAAIMILGLLFMPALRKG